MNRMLIAGVTAAALVAPLGLLTSATAAAPTTTLRPAQVERGPNPKIPHVDRTTIVDGDRRIRVNADHVELVGKSGSAAYVVRAWAEDGPTNDRLLRVTTGSTRVLARGAKVFESELSADGKRVALVSHSGTGSSAVRVISATTGSLHHRRVFARTMNVVEFAGGRVLLSHWGVRGATGRTLWWHPATNVVRTLVNRTAYLADASNDRLAFFTGDPIEVGGCSVLTKLSAPSVRVWRSCTELVAAISPDASRLATEHIIQDGPDSGVRRIRNGTGTLLAIFKADAFGVVQWETNRALLLDTHGETWAAAIRCTPASCNRASKLRPSQAGGI